MKILLLNPVNRSYVIMPSLGLGYLAAILTGKGNDVTILNCIKERLTLEEFGARIQLEHFELIGFQLFSYDLSSARRHLAIIRRYSPGTIVIAGGAHPSGDPAGTMVYLEDLEYAFQGEAEIGLPMLVEQLARGERNFASIPGLIWRSADRIMINPPQVVEDLDSLPLPAWELLQPELYPEAPHGAFTREFPTAPIITSRGCPSLCTFCAGACINGRKTRRRSLDNVLSELRLLRDRGIREFHIEDENFTLSREYVEDFCSRLKEENLGMSWSLPSGVRLDTLDSDILKTMASTGCYSLAIGIEFGSDRLLRLTRKGITVAAITEKMREFSGIDIKVTGFFMFGIPGETREEMAQTARLSRTLPLDRAQFNIFAPLPGSAEWQKLRKRGVLDALNPDRLFVHDVSYVEGDMTRNKLKSIQRVAVLRFYLRPRIILKLLGEIRSLKHLFRLGVRLLDTLR